MNFKRLEYFITIAETGNLRQASEILHLTPPALSKAMKLLEEELDSKLWIADGRRIILTDSGKVLLKRAPALINEFKLLKENLENKNEKEKVIRIGTFEVFSTYFLTFLNTLNWQDRSLELHELLPGEVEKYLIEGQIDVGITYMPIPSPQLDFIKVTSIEMGVYTKKGALKGIPQNELPYVVPVTPLQGVPTKVRGLDGWPEDAFERKITHRVTLMESALELCRQGLVAGYFPSFVVCEHNERFNEKYHLERRRPPALTDCKLRKSDVFLVKRKSTEEDDIIKQLAKAIRVIC
ncbi:LysR family transcriptional regulator [bacterium]|nr:LysR family transcriptional regulator [bacterium]